MKTILALLLLPLLLISACTKAPEPQSADAPPTSPLRTERLSHVEASFDSGFWGSEFTDDGAGVRSLDIKSFKHEDLLRITIQELPMPVVLKGYLDAVSKSLSDSKAELRVAENYKKEIAGHTFTCRKHINTIDDILNYTLSTCVVTDGSWTTMIMYGGVDDLLKEHAGQVNAVLEQIKFFRN